MDKRDYYEVLGVPREATPEEIKKAYRRLAVRHHPDRNPGDREAEERFKEAAEAYSVLADPQKRARYDRFGHAGVSGAGAGAGGVDPSIFADFGDIFGGSDFADMFGELFGFGDVFGRRGRRRRGQAGADLRYDLEIGLEEAAAGTGHELTVARMETCETCRGTGAEGPDGLQRCGRCGGRGQVGSRMGPLVVSRTCDACGGAGEVVVNRCGTCHGQRRVRRERTLNLRIPAGVDSGTSLRLSGEGEGGAGGGPPGDLYVHITLREHPEFERHGQDLICRRRISYTQAVLGTEIEVPTLLGGARKLKVPAGTASGTALRLRGEGMPRLGGGGRGDQRVVLEIHVPRRLSRARREALSRLAEIEQQEGEDGESGGGLLDRVKDFLAT